MRHRTCALAGGMLTLALLAGPPADASGGDDTGGASAAAPAILSRDWKRVQSTNFVVAGNAAENQLLDAIAQLERFHQTLLTLFQQTDLEPAVPQRLVLFKTASAFTPFKPRDERGRPRHALVGYFSMHPDMIYMAAGVMPDRQTTNAVIFHEYAHYVIHRSRKPVPAWVDEGLAEFYSTFRTDGEGPGILGHVPHWRLPALQAGVRLVTLEELMTARAARALHHDAEHFYAQAWALVHYSMLGDRAGQLPAYLRALDAGRSASEAFEEVYAVSFSALQAELRRYLRRPTLPALAVPLPPETDIEIGPVERMREADALQLQGDILMRQGAYEDAERLLIRALQIDPGHVPARVALAGVYRGRDRRHESLALLREAVAAAPDDFAAHYWLGVDLLHEHRFDEAVAPATRAVDLNERSADAWLQLSVAALMLGRDSQAAAAFLQARRLHPGASWYVRRAHKLFGLGHDAAAIADVAAYLRDAGWATEASTHMALLGALSHRRLHDAAAADALLAEAAAAAGPSSWEAAVIAHVQGELPAEALLRRARGVHEEMEARLYIGLGASRSDRPEEAIAHLGRVTARGGRHDREYGLARAELRRLERHPTP